MLKTVLLNFYVELVFFVPKGTAFIIYIVILINCWSIECVLDE